MSDKYHFPKQFKCMYCKTNLNPDEKLALQDGGSVDLKCPECGAIWKFWASVQLNHKLVKGGRFNKNQEPDRVITKDFDGWNEEKKHLHRNSHRPSFISEREIWWCSFGVNIGREQDGGGSNFERPSLVLRVLSPDTFVALPLSTRKRLERFQSKVTHDDVSGFALLDQIRVVDIKRLRRKVGTVSQEEFGAILEKLKKIL